MSQFARNFFVRFAIALGAFAILFTIIRISGDYFPIVVALLPLWAVGLVLGILAIMEIVDRWQQKIYFKRELKGLCIRCSYDLRASKVVCPECGMPILIRKDPTTRRQITLG